MKVYLTLSDISRLRWAGVPVERQDSPYIENTKPALYVCHIPDEIWPALDTYARQKGDAYAGLDLKEYLRKIFT